jgi:phytoene dehydrogenase-like protein
MPQFDAIIVGAGHNGLICAAYLARAGVKTLVLERRRILGGACVTEAIPGAPGYRVSTGAAQLGNLPPEIIEDLDLTSHGYDFVLPDPLSVFVQPDGDALTIWQDPARTRAEIQRFSQADADALGPFQKDCGQFCEILEPVLSEGGVPTMDQVRQLFQRARRPDLFRDFVEGGIWEVLKARFESPAVQGFLGLTATFGTNGGPRTPGTAYIMAHHLFGATAGKRGQTGYVRGGMGGLADALAGAARHHGAVLRSNTEVSEIFIHDGVAKGVALIDGERLEAPVVISNADPKRTYLGLIGGSSLPPDYTAAVQGIQTRGQALKVNCALSRLPSFRGVPEEITPARVTICPSLDYVEAAWAEARRGFMSVAPFMTVHMQSVVDDSLAPEGGHTLTCYAQYFPYDLDPSLGGWEAARALAGEVVIDTVADYAPDIREVITALEVMSPFDLEARFAMTGGHQFHGDMLPPNLFDCRPEPGSGGARGPIGGLYLCGAGTHPGGCVWGLPGQRAARAVISDLGGAWVNPV